MARVVSCLLLTAIFLGATVDVVHQHGTSPLKTGVGTPATAAAASAGTAYNSSTDDPLQSKDCSICQLHRQLSGGLQYGPVFLPAPPAQHAPVITAPVPYFSAGSTPRRGRAPPKNSLS